MHGQTARARIHCPQDAREGPVQVAIITSGGRSNPVTLLVDSTPAYSGGELLQPPVSIDGIARYRTPDRFGFDAKAGETLDFEVRAQRFGSPVDSQLRIVDSLGNQIAANDDYDFPGSQFSKDSYILREFKEGGRYVVEIRNLWKTTGEDFPYQLLVTPPHPRFELEIQSDTTPLYAGEPGSLHLKIVRVDGFKGPIHIEARGLAPGFTATPVEIAENQDEALIPVQATTGTKPSTYSTFKIVAQGSAKPAWHSARISSGGGEGETFATIEQGAVAVIERVNYSLEAAVETVNLVRGGTAEFQVAVARGEGFKVPLQFFFENLPAGVTAHQQPSDAGAPNVTIRLTAEKDARPGRFSRVAVLARSADGQVQQAPAITIVLD